ncbi:MAG: HYR domain-containing protein, partial [Lutibacter sp.]|nr:HYR domain-containing protein [Lutibacter sp.]
DNCGVGGSVLGTRDDGDALTDPYPVGVTTITCTISDIHGNAATSVNQLVTVSDDELPVITAKADIEQTADAGVCEADITIVDATATDNCGVGGSVLGTRDDGDALTDPYPVGVTTITWTVSDIHGNAATSVDQLVTVSDDEAPTITCAADITIATDKGECYATIILVEPKTDDNCGVASVTNNAPISNQYPFGITIVEWTVTDIHGNKNICEQTINVNQVTTVTTVTVTPEEQQYSDLVTFVANVTTCDNASTIGGSVEFKIGTQIMGTATVQPDGTATLADVVLLEPTPDSVYVSGELSPGLKVVTATYSGSGVYLTSSGGTNLEITKEEAVVNYIGNQLIATTNLSATIDLRVSVQDYADTYRGDIRNATVEFIINNNITAMVATPISQLIDPYTGIISKEWITSITKGSGSQEYTFRVKIDGYYVGEEVVPIIVYEPTGDFITGGGHIIPTASAGTYASTEGTKTNFGFNVKFNKKGTNLQGKLNFIWRTGGKVYQAKSNATDALGVDIADPSAKLAVFTSKCNINDITDPLNPVSLGGNKIMHITMTDRGEPGVNDDISFTLWDGNSLLYSSQWTGTSSSKMYLRGGNLIVHSGFSTGTTATKTEDAVAVSTQSVAEEVVDETLLFNATAYPNPSADYFTLKLQGMLNEASQKVEVNVFDVLGRQVYNKLGSAQDSYEFGQQFQVGVYLVTVKQGNNTASLKVIKK